MSKKQYKFDVFRIDNGTILLEKEYDTSGKVLLYSAVKLLDYERHTTIASGDVGEVTKELDSLIAALQTIRQELLGVQENPSQ